MASLTVKHILKKIFKFYKFAALIFAIAWWIYIVYDDYIFIQQATSETWPLLLKIWGLYFLIYFFAFSIYFWIAALLITFIYRMISKR